jgi:hypothetical protein
MKRRKFLSVKLAYVILLSLVAGLVPVPSPAGENLSVQAQGEYILYLPLVLKDFNSGPGTIQGKVVDSSRPDTPVEEALVCVVSGDGDSLCDTTDQDGNYSLSPAPSGLQKVRASKEGYVEVSSNVIVSAGPPVILNFALTQNLFDEMLRLRIVLTWDATPSWPPDHIENDLDAHFWLDAAIPTHIYSDPSYQGDCTNYPSACLEVDHRNGFGPETIAVRQLENAMYYYGVLNFNDGRPGVPPLSQLAPKVYVYDLDGLLQEFQLTSPGSGEFWYVFSMDAAGVITEKNCLISLPAEGELPQCP